MTEAVDRPPGRLLLVEDDAVIRETVRIALDRYGSATSVAADGLTGLELFREQRPDLLILDVMLPELDGCRTAPARPRDQHGADPDALGPQGLDRHRRRAGGRGRRLRHQAGRDPVLVARIRMLLRRAGFPVGDGGEGRAPRSALLRFGALTVDPEGLEVRRDGRWAVGAGGGTDSRPEPYAAGRGGVAVLAELFHLAGWIAFDAERHGVSQRFRLRALELARGGWEAAPAAV